MKRLSPILAAALAMAPASAATPADWSHAPQVDVAMANFSYAPKTIRLRAGQPVRLHLVNKAGGGHDFTARQFFAAAAVRPEDRRAIENGSVELEGGESRDILLVPKAGRYPVKCTHTLHKMLGMSGEIVVH